MKFSELSADRQEEIIESTNRVELPYDWDNDFWNECLDKYACEYRAPKDCFVDHRSDIELYFGYHWPMNKVESYAESMCANEKAILAPILELYEELQNDIREKIMDGRNALFCETVHNMLMADDYDEYEE